MDNTILEKVESDHYKKRPDVKVGDIVKLHLKIKEGTKERIQVFEGVVISIKGTGLGKTLTVRKISYGVGVEKTVPFHSPTLEKIQVVKRGTVRRSKLFYLRERFGSKALKVGNTVDLDLEDDVVVPTTGEAPEQEERTEDLETEATVEKEE
ncbi:50S ribosomal protein L19 [Candidatus Dojkabacteria bacterium]|uniref:Large ribosomal subunit protein bL19 n=1 Tax=Candidatus Dojkabacteria bacterium TaxID=2099670 RepID=A0A847VCX7_9BACT|nr:50S ribosomal protein L19 [Candidatus Dojkabacteria bacterium]